MTVDDFGLMSHCLSSFQPIYQYAFDCPLRKTRETINRFQTILDDFISARKDGNRKQNNNFELAILYFYLWGKVINIFISLLFFLLVIHIKIDFCLFKDSFCDHATRLPRSP